MTHDMKKLSYLKLFIESMKHKRIYCEIVHDINKPARRHRKMFMATKNILTVNNTKWLMASKKKKKKKKLTCDITRWCIVRKRWTGHIPKWFIVRKKINRSYPKMVYCAEKNG